MSDKAIELTRRRALVALVVLGIGAVAAGAGTFAAFSDTETTSGELNAGTLNLAVGQSTSLSFSADNMTPGDASGSGNATLEKTGSLNGNLTVEMINASGTDGTPGGVDGDSSAGTELDNHLEFTLWIENTTAAANGNDGSFDTGEDYLLNADGTVNHTSGSPTYSTADTLNGTSWDPTVDSTTLQNGNYEFHVKYDLPQDTSNEAQGDSINATWEIELNQTTS